MEKFSFESLREQNNKFVYRSYEIVQNSSSILLSFKYDLIESKETTTFNHKLELNIDTKDIDLNNLDNIVFHIGLIEAINYWKIATPQDFYIECGYISVLQLEWFKKLYYNGLGEFLYINKISITQDQFVNFIVDEQNRHFDYIKRETKINNIIPIGGGKDSLVTYELLKDIFPDSYMFSINPIKASRTILDKHPNNSIILSRKLDKKILEFNAKGYLNGHIPFSSIVAFISVWIGLIYKTKYIVLSNESSASEENIVFNDLKINHQYSKSFEFENDFRDYISKYITKDVEYFSFLRALDELTIAKLFTRTKKYFPIFLSCNVGGRQNRWCAKCPKCMFTYIMLCNYIDDEELIKIFGSNMLDDKELVEIFEKLYKSEEVKPFECVGTYDEVNYALWKKKDSYDSDNIPYLFKNYNPKKPIEYNFKIDFTNTNIPEQFVQILKKYV